MRIRAAAVSVAVALAVVACVPKDARSIWNDLLKKCASSQLIGNDVLYFGPSNNVSVGSVWRKDSDGGYYLRYLPSQVSAGKSLQLSASEATCSGTVKAETDASFGAGIDSNLAPLTGNLGVDIKRARHVTIKPSSFSWVDLNETEFESAVNNLPADSPIRADLGKTNRLVVVRALRVKGIQVDLEFSSADAVDVKGQLKQTPADPLAPKFNASWKGTNDTTLHLESANEFYVSGFLKPFSRSGLAMAGNNFGPLVKGIGKPTIGRDPDVK